MTACGCGAIRSESQITMLASGKHTLILDNRPYGFYRKNSLFCNRPLGTVSAREFIDSMPFIFESHPYTKNRNG